VGPIPKFIRLLTISVLATAPNNVMAGGAKLTLVIYDHAHIHEEILAEAENTASGIFEQAGVHLVWREGFEYAAERRNSLIRAPEYPATLVVKLQPESEAIRYGVRSTCGGIGFDSGAIIFVRRFDSRDNISPAVRLGCIIAHESGHILLGQNAHSIVGIMRGTLLPADWEKAAQGTLGFTHSQNQQIRAWIDQRLRR
jgi:hypothetical protein